MLTWVLKTYVLKKYSSVCKSENCFYLAKVLCISEVKDDTLWSFADGISNGLKNDGSFCDDALDENLIGLCCLNTILVYVLYFFKKRVIGISFNLRDKRH